MTGHQATTASTYVKHTLISSNGVSIGYGALGLSRATRTAEFITTAWQAVASEPSNEA